MISRDAAALAVRALDDLLVGLASGVLAAQRRIAAAAGVALDDMDASTRAEARTSSEASAHVADGVPVDLALRYHDAFRDGVAARERGDGRDANPYIGDRGIAGGRRIAWLRGWDSRGAA